LQIKFEIKIRPWIDVYVRDRFEDLVFTLADSGLALGLLCLR